MLDEYSWNISWGELDEKLTPCAPNSAGQRVGPIGYIVEPYTVGSECSAGFRQERDPKRHSVLWHAQNQRGFVFAPDRDGRAEQGAMNFLIVASGDFPSQRALEFAERHGREPPGLVALAGDRIGKCRSRIEMNSPHHRSDQTLDVAAIVGSACGAKD